MHERLTRLEHRLKEGVIRRGEAGIERGRYRQAVEYATGLQTVLIVLAWVLGADETPIGEREIEQFATELY